jgi:hypothetical protein
MPEGAGHDHASNAHHGFACGLAVAAFRELKDLVPEPTMFGEVDIAGDIAVMATSFPEAGFVVFDISDPVNPVAESRFHGPNCEQVVYDIDCGTDVKLSPDGTAAFLSTQYLTRVPGAPQNPESLLAPPEPGILAVDLSDPRRPLLTSWLPVEALGVHMFAYHEIGGQAYLFAIDNTLGITVARVDRVAGKPVLQPVPGDHAGAGGHDVFLFDDPVDRKTYLYVAASYDGLEIFDVTDPTSFIRAGQWRPPAGRWYSHTTWTFRWGAHRYTLVVPELFQGSGEREVGPLWLVDTTNHSSPELVGTWTNPGRHRGGDLGFSPHNFWYAGDGIVWLAHYHGGVWLLDWKDVLNGSATAPGELGYAVPNLADRAFATANPLMRFITGFDIATQRPAFWDVVSDGAYGYASDINGGFYVLQTAAR